MALRQVEKVSSFRFERRFKGREIVLCPQYCLDTGLRRYDGEEKGGMTDEEKAG